MNEEIKFPIIAYGTFEDGYRIITISKQGHIFYSKKYRNKREAEIAISKKNKKGGD